ncbi:MAG: hypothetical protein RDU14_01020 [Melioribacteraceae bacterium]|nr:hypothetical protein [Melioribacteraceae bacterium]
MDWEKIIFLIIGAAVTQLANIFFVPIKKFFRSEDTEECVFKHPEVYEQPSAKEVTVYKRFRKTQKVKCPWFNRRSEKVFENKKYLICPFGKTITDKENLKGGVCRFM